MTIVKNYAFERGVSTLERPRYSAGLLLEDDDLTAAVNYTRNMMRLMFKSLFGCGVICGLDVTAQLTCNRTRVEVTVGKGVALDCLGDPIEIPKAVKVTYDADCDPVPEWLWVTVCYHEKCCRPKDISCSPDEHGQIVQTRVMDGFEVRVYPKRPKCACSCEPPDKGARTPKSDCCEGEEDETTSDDAASAVEKATAALDAAKEQLRAREEAEARRRREVAARLELSDPGTPFTPDHAITLTDEFTPLSERTGGLVEGSGTDTTDRPRPRPQRELCDCYQDHFDGKCECDCCCPCVLVGKIHTTRTDKNAAVDANKSDAQGLSVDRQWVRWIRPMLVGYYKCIKTVSNTMADSTKYVITKPLRDSGGIADNLRG